MPVVEEDGGRLNAFAKEPKVQVVQEGPFHSWSSRLILMTGVLLICGLIALTVTIS